MSNNRKPLIYDKTIETTPEHWDEAAKELDKLIKNAPKPNEYLDRPVEVNHKFVCADNFISINENNIHELLKQHGLWQEKVKNSSNISEEKITSMFVKKS